MARKQLGAAPTSNSTDAATTAYVTTALAGAGGGVSQTYVDSGDAASKAYAKSYTDTMAATLVPYAYDWTTSDLTLPANSSGVASTFEAFDCTSNSVTITVPHSVNTAPGVTLRFLRIDTVRANTATITVGSPDVIQLDVATTTYSSINLAPREYIELVWDGSIWHPAAARIGTTNGALGTGPFDSTATPGAAMVRDTAGRAQVVDPSASADIATKNYVDTQDAAVSTTATGVAAAMALVFGG